MFCLWGPAIVDVVASIAVVREAGSEAVFACEFPHRVRLSAADAGDPTGTELNRHAAETLLADPAADAVGGFEDHQVLHAVLGQHLRRGDSFKIRIKKTNTQWDWFEKASRKFNIETVVTVEERERERESRWRREWWVVALAELLTGDAGTDDDDGGARRGIHDLNVWEG